MTALSGVRCSRWYFSDGCVFLPIYGLFYIFWPRAWTKKGLFFGSVQIVWPPGPGRLKYAQVTYPTKTLIIFNYPLFAIHWIYKISGSLRNELHYAWVLIDLRKKFFLRLGLYCNLVCSVISIRANCVINLIDHNLMPFKNSLFDIQIQNVHTRKSNFHS